MSDVHTPSRLSPDLDAHPTTRAGVDVAHAILKRPPSARRGDDRRLGPIVDVWRMRIEDAIARAVHRRRLTSEQIYALIGATGDGSLVRQEMAAIRLRLDGGRADRPGLRRLVR